MSEIFPVHPIHYEGPQAHSLLAYRYYDPTRLVRGKTMQEHLRMALCWWHNFCWPGNDIFGEGTFMHPWLSESDPMKAADLKVQAMFELLQKLNLHYFTFHDRDVAPIGKNLKETERNLAIVVEKIAHSMQTHGKELLWGTANLFSHKRYMTGAATNPNPEIFAHAVAQVKTAMDVTHQLKGHNYVFWGGREGYETLLNTDLKQESEQLACFLKLAVEYKHKIGFKGTLLIEPKPCEPSKHQYDYDTATVFAFLQKYGLEKEFKVNIEGNHATLSGHSYPHEVIYALANDMFGSIDANQGDPQIGWDLDLYPSAVPDNTLVLYHLLKHGGFKTGGFNFDTKLRRQSIDLEDYFYGHILAIDSLAKALLAADALLKEDELQKNIDHRYAAWQQPFGQSLLKGQLDMEAIAQQVLSHNTEPEPVSGQQERLELIFQRVGG